MRPIPKSILIADLGGFAIRGKAKTLLAQLRALAGQHLGIVPNVREEACHEVTCRTLIRTQAPGFPSVSTGRHFLRVVK
jgi:hypothetical protein